jgi:probable HAF family extracellular repeat protein
MEVLMRSTFLRCCLVTLSLASVAVDCMGQATPEWRHYKLIDLGTFGGPDSIAFFVQHVLTENGIVAGVAESNIPDPFTTSCPSPNCKITYGFVWQGGVKTRLSGLVRGALTEAQSVNERGTVAGDSRDGTVDPGSGSAVTKATVWRNDRIINLGTLGGPSSAALSISRNDLVTGWSEAGGTETHGFLWWRGEMVDLGTLGGPVSFGIDVNDQGQVAGFSYVGSAINPATGIPTQHPFIWEKGRMTDISLGGSLGGAGLINNRGQAIGDSNLPGDTEDHAFLWSNGAVHDLGTLGGTFSQPTGLTELTHISGVASPLGDQVVHAVLWKDGSIHDLGSVDGDGCSWAWGLNSRDQVVGISNPYCDFTVARAFLWDHGTMVDLNTLVPADSTLHLVYAEAINDAGEIVGIGVPPGVSPVDVERLGHAYVLIPDRGAGGLTGASAAPNADRLAGPHLSTNFKAATADLIRRLREHDSRRLANRP